LSVWNWSTLDGNLQRQRKIEHFKGVIVRSGMVKCGPLKRATTNAAAESRNFPLQVSPFFLSSPYLRFPIPITVVSRGIRIIS
jgi:hypothetical protein